MRNDVVLLVEDDAAIRQVMEKALEEWLDIHTVLAANGLEALEIVWAIKPALIVLDIAMPEFDGFEVMKALKGRPSTQDIPVIVVTGTGRAGDDVRAAGADECISKPFSLEAFARAVRKYLPPVGQEVEL